MRTRELGNELRQARKARGIPANMLARKVGWTDSKVSRIETGRQACSDVDAAIILGYLGVPRGDFDRIIGLCRGTVVDGAWLRHHGERLPDQLRTLVLHESIASVISGLELSRVPALLQTEDYAREIIRNAHLLPTPAIESRVRARMERRALFKRAYPPQFVFYIHEYALRLPIGGDRVMHEQMLELVFRSGRPYCSIRVIPAAEGAHAGLDGPFRFMQFSEDHPVVYLETGNRSVFLESALDIATYRLILARLADVALSTEESRSMLVALASEYDRPEVCGDDEGVATEQSQRH